MVSSDEIESRTANSYLPRCVQILDAVAQVQEPQTQAQLAVSVGLPRPTVHRLARHLVGVGMLRESVDSRLSFGERVLSWGYAALRQFDFTGLGHPYLMVLSAETSETAHLGVMEAGVVVHVDRVDSLSAVRTWHGLAGKTPWNCTALGKCMVALCSEEEQEIFLNQELVKRTKWTVVDRAVLKNELGEIARVRYAKDDGENEEGVRCFAAPVFDRTGKVCAAISISGPNFRMTDDELYVKAVKQAAEGLSREMGAPGLGSSQPAKH